MSNLQNPAEAIKAMTTVQVQRIRDALQDRIIRNVAKNTGLHENTVRNLKNAKGGVPSMETIEKLTKYLFA